jgi:hypothetical protein
MMNGRKEGLGLKSQVEHANNENKENDLIDAMVGTGVSTAIFMGIFIIATVISFLK